MNSVEELGQVFSTTKANTPKTMFPSSIPAPSYVQRLAFCSNRSVNNYVFAKWVEVVEKS